ncbi:hypothetical protein KIN20_026509 [Parelaphostrongylus tenuis]|uniref:Uncharacterized protein n=1 Tax=Parelaphostrongylus tenuis TaxID=148309 RepID=A0AAD5QY33_PARTN|nr:hypothetical protein KIN20_026509 [Parelaphostrongylus tenuis]
MTSKALSKLVHTTLYNQYQFDAPNAIYNQQCKEASRMVLCIMKVNTRDVVAEQLHLIFDNVSKAALVDSEFPEPYCAWNASEFVELSH